MEHARKKYIVANWKMHLTVAEGSLLIHRLDEQIKQSSSVEVVICPNTLSLQPLSLEINRKKFRLGAQNFYHKDEGPFTGEVSISMLRGLIDYALVGHSERRMLFGERDSDIALKVSAALRHGITPILCVGETLMDRQDNATNRVLHDQLVADLNMLTAEDVAQVVIAYEPLWAISSGSDYQNHELPKPDEIEKAATQIRGVIEYLHDAPTAKSVPVLYGGSVYADLAKSYVRIKGISGLLVGGASLNYQQFSDIVAAAEKA
jgi:triosephosphate isomerase